MKKVFKFHQFVVLEKGPANTCISNLLNGEIYQVPNRDIEKFNARQYTDIPDFMDSLKEAELVIEVEETRWIPYIDPGKEDGPEFPPIILEVESGADIGGALDFASRMMVEVKKIHYFGETGIDEFAGIPVVKMQKDFAACRELTIVTGDFDYIDQATYSFNMKHSSCWGGKIAVAKDGTVRPCIYSKQIIGGISSGNDGEMMEKAETFRKASKDKVDKCKECEFKYVCFDCREIAMQEGGQLYAANPGCGYDHFTGNWKEKQVFTNE